MNSEVRGQIGKRMLECRKAANMTQDDVAAELGLRRQAVSRWENGKDMPSAEAWYRLGPLYGVSLDYLIYGIRTIPISQHAVMASVFRLPESAT